MDEETLLRVEDALGVYDRTHKNPAYPDGRDPISRDVSLLIAEVRRLRKLLGIAAEACCEREIPPHLIDVLAAEGYETQPRPPDPEEWRPLAPPAVPER